MALRSEPGMPAAYVLLGEEMFDFKHSSKWCESRSLFIASGLEEVKDFMSSPQVLLMQGEWRKATPLLLTVHDLETSLSSSTTYAQGDRPKAQPQALMLSPRQRQAPFPEPTGFRTPHPQLTELLLA